LTHLGQRTEVLQHDLTVLFYVAFVVAQHSQGDAILLVQDVEQHGSVNDVVFVDLEHFIVEFVGGGGE